MHCYAKKRFSTSSQQHKFPMRKHTDRLHSQESPHDSYDSIMVQKTFWIRRYTLNKSNFRLNFHRTHFRLTKAGAEAISSMVHSKLVNQRVEIIHKLFVRWSNGIYQRNYGFLTLYGVRSNELAF